MMRVLIKMSPPPDRVIANWSSGEVTTSLFKLLISGGQTWIGSAPYLLQAHQSAAPSVNAMACLGPAFEAINEDRHHRNTASPTSHRNSLYPVKFPS